MLDSAVQDAPSEPAKILEDGKKYTAERRFPEAIEAFRRFKRMAPREPQVYFFSGIAFAESGHLNTDAAELFPEHASWLAWVKRDKL